MKQSANVLNKIEANKHKAIWSVAFVRNILAKSGRFSIKYLIQFSKTSLKDKSFLSLLWLSIKSFLFLISKKLINGASLTSFLSLK